MWSFRPTFVWTGVEIHRLASRVLTNPRKLYKTNPTFGSSWIQYLLKRAPSEMTPPLEDGLSLDTLTQPHFFIPRLVNKPQNPIMEMLTTSKELYQIKRLPSELELFTKGMGYVPDCRKPSTNIWIDAMRRTSGSRVSVVSHVFIESTHTLKLRIKSGHGMPFGHVAAMLRPRRISSLSRIL
jgi:hypothetical protein